MKHNIDLIKQIREAYAKEEGYKSFASMALNVNIVPRDITEIAKRYAEGINSELQAKLDKYENALREIEDSDYPITQKELEEWLLWAKRVAREVMPGYKKEGVTYISGIANEALSGEGKEVEKCTMCNEKPKDEGLSVCKECYLSFDGDRRCFWTSDSYH